ncbi:MAG: hypothetical protein HMLKMBBP_01753 [Planctomycetes bacterium]|nr:hypothetical protein [Planctomycetota bacterium]
MRGGMSWFARWIVSSGVSGAPCTFRMWPDRRIVGGRPTAQWRSDPFDLWISSINWKMS